MKDPGNKISALIISFNEIGYIERCIDSVSFADEIIVVDSYSTDGTFEYLHAHPKVKVIQRPFQNFTAQKTFALEQASNDWILFVDADEVVSEELRAEIITKVQSNSEIVAYWFYRTFMFQQEKLKFSGWQTDKNHRLFRKSKVRFTNSRLVHETLEVDGISGIFKEKLIHRCYKNYENYKAKMLHYGKLKAQEKFSKGVKFNYLRLLLKPSWKFFYNFIIRLGILDGMKGLTVCYLDALSIYERYTVLRRIEQQNDLSSRQVYYSKNIKLTEKELVKQSF